MKKLLPISFILALILTGLASCKNQQVNHETLDWAIYGNDYASQRFSKATQINADNVKDLTLAWQHNSGIVGSFQTTPIVQAGVMYFSLPFNHVVALDAATGEELWRYEHERREDWKLCCGPANRGIAVSEGKVYMGTVDARLVALDANNGNKL